MNPLASLDLETTGTKVATDRIVQIGIHYIQTPEGPPRESIDLLINPGVPIPPEATDCHGITDEMVKDKPTFAQVASALMEAIRGCDLVGFNLSNFDVPLLWEEFHRVGITWSLAGVSVVDVGTLYKKLNPRTLSAAVEHYCGREHEGAHSAIVDAKATADVFISMTARHDNLRHMSVDQLAEESQFEKRFDLAGLIVAGKDGRPCYGFGKNKGTAINDDPGFGYWMLNRDFPTQTLMVLREILDGPRDDSRPF
jgi:DNA polymerase-3 subunit epsilon